MLNNLFKTLNLPVHKKSTELKNRMDVLQLFKNSPSFIYINKSKQLIELINLICLLTHQVCIVQFGKTSAMAKLAIAEAHNHNQCL